jgi:hypothetical protein
MKKLVFLLSLVVFLGGLLIADISDYYEFVAGTTTYTEITGTQQTSAMGDDVTSTAIDLGFTFPYGDNTYTQIKINSNGVVTLGTVPVPTLTNNLMSTTICPVVAALWDDLHTGRVQDTTYPQTSSVETLLQGTAPNRTFTVQYKNAYWYYSVSTSWVNFQVVLHESGNIDLIYGPNAGTGPGTSATASIGLNMLPGGAGNILSVNPLTMTASTTTETNNISAYITPGTKFSFNVPVGLPNDLSCLSVTGEANPSVGTSYPYTVNVRNRGTNPQSNYMVKLMSGTTELATVNGTLIQPGQTLPFTLNWTPTTTGQVQLHGWVIQAEDQNPNNDMSGPINVTVHPAGTQMVIIGNGTSAQSYPFYTVYGYVRDAAIYTAAEVGIPGLITGIQWDVAVQYGHSTPYRILMKTTTATALVAQPWDVTIADAQLVAEGTVTFDQVGWTYIPFTIPFVYTGAENLVVMVESNYGGAGTTNSQTFRYTTSTTASHHYMYQDTTPPPGNGYVSASRPNIGLTLTAVSPNPAFAVSPASWNYGQTFVNMEHNKVFTITNVGGGTTPLVINNITIGGSPFFTLQNLPTLPLSLNSFQSVTFTARYNPTAVGNHTATIVITDNLTRTQHPVDLQGSCIDPTIYTSPYFQNFDTVTVPALPIDWSSYSVAPGYVTTVTTSPYSAPNCVYLYNSTSANGPYLISPPISPTMPLVTMRVKFWAKGSTTYTLSVGGMSNPLDAATYTQVSSFTLTSAWAEYQVGFQTYAGTGQFIAFKHGNASTSQSIYIDNVTIEVIPQNDLAALNITGNATPSVNMATNYSVTIKNEGTNQQSNYQVKLFREGDIEVGSVAGPVIAPGATAQVTIPWTPTTQGPTYIYGKVVLTGDQNNLNDQTANLNVSVQPAGVTAVTIGDGSQTQYYMPVCMYYKSSLFQSIYYQSEMNVYGLITAVSFYNNFLTNLPAKPTKVWLGTTTQADLSAGFIPSTAMTLVYDGTVDYPSGQNTIVIPLQTPFPYMAGNLVIMVQRPLDTVYHSSSDLFFSQTIGTNRARRVNSDTVDYDPANPPTTSTLTGQFPKTTFMMLVEDMGSLGGTVSSGGSPLEGALVSIVGTTSSQLTNSIGTYNFPFVQPGTYQVTCSKLGYMTQTQQAVIVADQATTLNFNMVLAPSVNVTGTVVGSEAPTVGLANAAIALTGVINYNGSTNAQGQFTISNVLAGNTYNYVVSKMGYQNATGSITLGTTNYNMGTIILPEIAMPAVGVTAALNMAETEAVVMWSPPGATGPGYFFDFEFDNGEWVRSSSWTDPLGDWEWTNTYNIANWNPTYTGPNVVPPPAAYSGTGMWGTKVNTNYNNSGGFNYLTKILDFTGFTNTRMNFRSWENVFGNFDYAQVSINGTVVWGPSWDYTNTQWQNRMIDLSAYDGMANVAVRFEMWATVTVNYAGWYIDDVYIGPESGLPTRTVQNDHNAPVITTTSNDRDRPAIGYKVWRLLQGMEANEASWTLLTPATITDTFYVNTGWQALPDGEYRWAVKTVYTNDVLSPPAFSNMLRKRPNDLSALTITGSLTPSVGAAFNYTVNIRNTGTAAQTAGSYTVKIMSGTTELASVPGPAIQPNETLDVIIPWTPATSGSMTIYGKVVLPTDTLPTNDSTPTLTVFVHPEGTLFVTIGEGTSAQSYPFYTTYGYVRDAAIYTNAEIGVPGQITGIQWDCAVQYGHTTPYRILMKMTTDTQLVAQPWATTIADAQLVAEGTVTFNSVGWVYIPFTTPFVYTGNNLVVMVESNYGGAGTSNSQTFRYTTSTTASHHYNYADTTPPTTNGYVNASRPNIGLSLTSIGNAPVFNVSPTSWNYGQTFVNMVHNKSFTITNIGGGTTPLVITNIVISGSPFFTLQNLPTLPASLNGFQSVTFTARYNPTAVGNHTATILITDNLTRTHVFRLGGNQRDGATRTDHPVELTASCIDPTIYTSPYTQNFDAVTVPNLPIDWLKLEISPGTVQTNTTSPYSTPNCVRLLNSTATNGPFLISPPISSTLPLNTMRIKFWVKGVGAYQLSVGAMTDPLNADTYTQVSSFAITTTWTEYVVGFQTYAGAGQFMAIKHGNAATSQTIYIDNVTIEVIPQNDLAALSVTGNVTPTVNMSTNYTVNLFNWGTNPQTNYQVKLFREGDIEIASVAGPAIQPGMNAQAVVSWVPTVQGPTYIYGKVVLTGDQNNLNDQTPNLNVSVYPAGTMVVTVGDGSQTQYYMPVCMFYKSSLFQSIYYQNELNFIGLVTGVSFYNNFLTNLPNRPTKVWLGTTTLNDLSAGWIPSTQMTLVYDGTVNYPSGQNTVTITLPEPFLYLEGNLVMMVQRPLDTVYYSSSDLFYAQTVGTNRARRVNSDTVEYDPAIPPTTSTLTGQFPKTSFMVIPGGVGHLTGTVLGAGNVPLPGATIQIVGGGQATTNAQGQYTIMNIIADTYQVTASRHGYITQTISNVVIPEDSTIVLDFTLTQMPTVNVTGTIVGSDAPTVGLAGAIISLSGYEDYQTTANAQGQFTITGVYTNQTYNYAATALGYQEMTGTINVGTGNLNMGTVTLSEIAYTPRTVNATQNTAQTQVTVTWQAPDPNAVDITESFENAQFPPADWTRIVTNNGPANTLGVYPTWSRFGTIVSGTTTIAPHAGAWQCGFWWDYNHQDEWLMTPQFNCPQGATLTFWTYAFYGSLNNDHYYVKISSNNGNTWQVLWDASALTGGWNNYQTPVVIDLNAYTGQQVKIAWHADDPNTSSDGMWYNWFIDDIVIGSQTMTIRFSESDLTARSGSAERNLPLVAVGNLSMSRAGDKEPGRDGNKSHLNLGAEESIRQTRSIEGYKVWRLLQGQELNEATWTLLTPQMITDLSHVDAGWSGVAAGTYKWAVKAMYTNDVVSLAAFSNPLVKAPLPSGTLVGVVRNSANIPIQGAVVSAGTSTTTTLANGSYNMSVPVGTYAVTCTAAGYNPATTENIVIVLNQTTICNFTMSTGIETEVEIVKTELKGNYPNPFNPQTIISYAVKDRTTVRLEIYNLKGQLVRTLVNEWTDKGNHQVTWNGRDDSGNPVASGIYHYRMQAGDYKANRRMMLLK